MSPAFVASPLSDSLCQALFVHVPSQLLVYLALCYVIIYIYFACSTRGWISGTLNLQSLRVQKMSANKKKQQHEYAESKKYRALLIRLVNAGKELGDTGEYQQSSGTRRDNTNNKNNNNNSNSNCC